MTITHDQSYYSSRQDGDLSQPSVVEVRKVTVAAPVAWLQQGWDDFYRIPALSLLYGVLSVAGCYLMFLYARESLALLLGLFSGVLLAGPFVAVGLYAAARDMEAGYPATIGHSFHSIGAAALRIALISVFLAVVYIVWLRISSIIVALHYAAFRPDAVQMALANLDWGTLSVLALYVGIGFLFALLAFVTMAISLPMILDRDIDPVTAVLTSMRAVNANRLPMLLWAALIAAAAVVSFATAFLGFAVLFPVLGYATWHSYRDLVSPVSRAAAADD